MKGEKQTKEQLVNEPAEIRLADIVDFLPDPTFAVDLSGKVIVWNHAIEEMTGVKAEDMLGKGDHEYIVPFYGVPRPVLIDLALKHDEELEKKYDFVKREGDVLLAEAEVPVRGVPRILWGKARPLYDNNGDIIGAIESVRDITMLRQAKEVLQKAHDELENRVRERTVELMEMNDALQKEIFERERAEAVLKESEEKYNQFFKTSRDCVFITSNDGRIVDTNDAAMELLGYSSRDELLKMKVPDLYADPEERVKHLRIIAKQGYAKEFPVDMRRKDGSIRHTLVTSAARYDADGNPIGAQGTIRDITERKLAEEALKSSEEKYRQIFEGATEGIYQTTPKGVYLSVNPAFARMFGYTSPQDMIDSVKNIGEERYVNP
ncbi:MAG: PAS domain S-box protein, partial [Syntrophaceae bacterium]